MMAVDPMQQIQNAFDRRHAAEMSKHCYGMAKDCLQRTRLFMGNSGWVVDELTMALGYRDRARAWRNIAMEIGTK